MAGIQTLAYAQTSPAFLYRKSKRSAFYRGAILQQRTCILILQMQLLRLYRTILSPIRRIPSKRILVLAISCCMPGLENGFDIMKRCVYIVIYCELYHTLKDGTDAAQHGHAVFRGTCIGVNAGIVHNDLNRLIVFKVSFGCTRLDQIVGTVFQGTLILAGEKCTTI